MIELKESERAVGRIIMRPVKIIGQWEIGYWLHPDFQGRGLMTEAARAELQLGFEQIGAAAIVCASSRYGRARRFVSHHR